MWASAAMTLSSVSVIAQRASAAPLRTLNKTIGYKATPTRRIYFCRQISMFQRAICIVALASAAAACSKSETAQARGRDDGTKPVKVEAVSQQAVTRSVEVVGTLAAVDEVTVSSEADGIVSRILHDLGDRVHAGDVLVELDREKAEYNLTQQRAALARALAQYGAPDTAHLPGGRANARRAESQGRAGAGPAVVRPRQGADESAAGAAPDARRCGCRAAVEERRATNCRCRTRRTFEANIWPRQMRR